MTVKSLIEVLSKLPPDLHVYVETPAGLLDLGNFTHRKYCNPKGRYVVFDENYSE